MGEKRSVIIGLYSRRYEAAGGIEDEDLGEDD